MSETTKTGAGASDAAAGSAAPGMWRPDLESYMMSFHSYLRDYGLTVYARDEALAREWWLLGTEPFEAAKHVAQGTRPWALEP